MKQKKFSQIYREAAERLFKDNSSKLGCCYYISASEGFAGYKTGAQFYFSYLFQQGIRVYYFGELEDQDCINHRITALLLASEIAKSEGL